MAKNNEVDFKTKLEELNKIVDQISSKTLTLDESLKLYEKGQEIVKELEKELKEAEEKVEKIVAIE